MEYPYALNVVQEAFAILGQSSLPEIVDDEQDNPTFRDCSRIYDTIRKAVLTAHPWNFALVKKRVNSAVEWETRRRAEAGAVTSYLTEQRIYITEIPPDCLLLLRLENCLGDEVERTRYGNLLHTKEEVAEIIYLRDEEDPDVWDPWARKALVHRLAADFARIVKGSLQERQLQEEAYNHAIADAKRVNSQEGFGRVSKTYADRLIRGLED